MKVAFVHVPCGQLSVDVSLPLLHTVEPRLSLLVLLIKVA